MNKIGSAAPVQPSGPSSLTLADVKERIRGDDHLSRNRRRDLISAINRVCGILDRDPALILADIPNLKAGLAAIHPAQIGITVKTLQNLKSNVLSALKHASGDQPPSSRLRPLAAPWSVLWASLPDKRFQGALSRFIHYCSNQAIAPEAVSDAVVEEFMTYVRTQTFVRKPNDVHRRTTRLWNEASDTIPGWPKITVFVPDFRKPRESTPLEEFLPSFQKDVEAHVIWLSGHDLFAENAPPKPCKPSTIKLRRSHIILAASALLKQGWEIKQITSLEDIVSAVAMKAVLRHYLEKTNQGPTTFMHGIAKTLIHIARHYVRVDHAHVEALKGLRRRLGPEREGMTEKNKRTLRQFDDERNILLLLELPNGLVTEVARGKLSVRRAAVKIQIALAISILLRAPLRMHNLVELRLDEHIIRPGGKRGPVLLVIPDVQAKGGEVIEYPIQGETKDLLDLYLTQYRPVLCGDRCPWLFPSLGDKRKSQPTLSQQIGEAIEKKTGLKMTPHQFRHLAAKILLDQNPGQYEALRQLLAHKSTKATMTFYAGLQTANAARHYDQIINEKRERLSQRFDKNGRKR